MSNYTNRFHNLMERNAKIADRSLRCDVCQLSNNSRSNYTRHLSSEAHRLNIANPILSKGIYHNIIGKCTQKHRKCKSNNDSEIGRDFDPFDNIFNDKVQLDYGLGVSESIDPNTNDKERQVPDDYSEEEIKATLEFGRYFIETAIRQYKDQLALDLTDTNYNFKGYSASTLYGTILAPISKKQENAISSMNLTYGKTKFAIYGVERKNVQEALYSGNIHKNLPDNLG
ncbi:uncharacterized protein EV154DRAFT_486602 [Mucor mucedo]|uniref:uncharacterized protein n=1 Tax=Mucor mucedo TaxID=29922 RepID=UPI00222045B5|nr:uncharacterized protein EV154DRAFT_486602 [Mucor mucedo]KAI7875927.1 hypothetical protein EV154DRAFT_486602 [Mucor mucedo]